MAYRVAEANDEPPDAEAVAIALLAERTRRLTALVVLPLVLASLGLATVLYGALRDWQFEHDGAYSPWLTGVVALVPSLGGALYLCPHVINAILRLVKPIWRASLAKRFDLDEAQLEETTRFM